MNLELQNTLFARYPRFYRPAETQITHANRAPRDGRQNKNDRVPFDDRGIECGVGWFAEIVHLSRTCESEIDSLCQQGVPSEKWPRVAQIKEKLGGLSFYVTGRISRRIRSEIMAIEIQTGRIREGCGVPSPENL